MEFVTGQRQVVLNFSEKFCKSPTEVLNSDCFKEVWTKYLKHIYETENQSFLPVLTVLLNIQLIYSRCYYHSQLMRLKI